MNTHSVEGMREERGRGGGGLPWGQREGMEDVPRAERRQGGCEPASGEAEKQAQAWQGICPRAGEQKTAPGDFAFHLFPGEIRASENSYFCQAARQLASVSSSQLCVKLASGGDPTYAFNIRFTGEEVHGTSE